MKSHSVVKDSRNSSIDDHYQQCTYNQANLKKRIRYYTPQPSINESFVVESVNASLSKFKIGSDHEQNTRDFDRSSDQRNKSEVVTCFKNFFEPSKVVQGAMRTQSLLRRCYTPNPGFKYRIEISPKEETKAKKQLPELPNRILTSDRYRSETQNIIKQFSSLSKTSLQNVNFFGFKKPIKERPKLDEVVDMKHDETGHRQVLPTNSLSPAIAFNAEKESKNFLYDMYLKKAEDGLEEFEIKKETSSLPECLRQLDRCIEFYELALKTLGGDKDKENSRILLRAKQTKLILKKRHIWKIKSSQRPSDAIDNSKDDKNDGECRSYENQILNARAFRPNDDNVLRERFASQSRPYSAVSNRSLPVNPKNVFNQNCADFNSLVNISNGCRRDTASDNAFQPGKIKVSYREDVNKRNVDKISSAKVDSLTSVDVMSRRKLPRIPEFRVHETIDIKSRRYGNEPPFVKISLV